jgi:hypothetical protein
MRPSWTRKLGLVAIAGAIAWSSVGCSQEREPINRVQAGALSKHFLVGASLSDPSDDGEFYMRNTVIDVPYGSGQDGLFTATYAQPLSRIKWEITETSLVARRTHESVADTDHKGARRTNDGQVVAMFIITSHFDVRYAYNSTTGEEINLVEENTTDRPWYQREFIRVDWSKNLVTDGYEVDTLSQLGLFGGLKFDPMSYRIEDPNDPNAPQFDVPDGYFDVTTKVYATPQMVDTPWGKFPYCWFYGQQGTNCNATEATLRLSFRKVVDHDYEPTEWDGSKMDAFGWFYEDRLGYERNYGLSDEKWHRFAAKHNIWEKSHIEGSQCAVDFYRDKDGNIGKYKPAPAVAIETGLPIPDPNGVPFAVSKPGYDIHGDGDNDGTEDECNFAPNGAQIHSGSRCDELSHKCTLPLHERKLVTTPWYYAAGSPADLFASTKYALSQWNISVQLAAFAGQRAEATRVGLDGSGYIVDEAELKKRAARKEELLHRKYDFELRKIGPDLSPEEKNELAAMPQDIFVLCHSPSITKQDALALGLDPDPEACSPNGKRVNARLGDIRYHSVNLIESPQTPSPWGIMVDANDPLTGEKISTSVNEWVGVLDISSQAGMDLIRWINGEISDDQIRGGQYIRDWAAASKLGTAQNQPKTLDRKEIESRLKSIQVANMTGALPQPAGTLSKMTPRQIDNLANQAAKTLQQKLGPSLDAQFEGFRQELIGTKFEAMMATPEMVQAAGFDPQTPIAGDDSILSRVSPMRGMHPQMQRWMNRLKATTGALRSCVIEQPEPDSLVGLARHAARLYPMPVKNDDFPANLAKRNSALQKWLREQLHVSVILHEMGHSMGLRHNFTGSWDAMNYHPEYWQLRTRNGQEKTCSDLKQQHVDGKDCVGPRWIDPVTDEEVNGLIWKWGSSTVMDYPGDLTQDTNDLGSYDKAAVRFAYGEVIDVDADKGYNSTRHQAYMSRLDGFGGISGPLDTFHYTQLPDITKPLGTCEVPTDPNDPLSAKCTGYQLDYVSVRDTKSAGTDGRDAHFAVVTSGPLSGPKNPYAGRARHPYMFGSDEYADTGNMPVFRFDAGADAYEQMQFLTSTYENRYVFDNFRRERTNFFTGTVVNRTRARYFDKMTAAAKSIALYLSLFPQFKDELLNEPGFLLAHSIAASDSLATFIRILTRPEPGNYVMNGPLAEATDDTSLTTLFRIPVGSGDGRFLHNDYDYSKGYNWGRYQTQVGSSFEKRDAIYYLLEAYNNFVQNSKRDYIDGRFLNLNYTSLYPDQMRRIFAALMQDDGSNYGPFVDQKQAAAGGSAHVQYLPWEKYVPGDALTTEPAYPAGTTVLNPLVGWEQQYPALIDAFYFGGTTLTMDWIQQMAIYSPGDLASYELPPSEQVRYVDPLTTVTYVARNYGSERINGKAVSRSSGARMLQYASQLAQQTYKISGTPDPQTGEVAYERDPSTREPVCKLTKVVASSTVPDVEGCEAAKAHIRRYSSNLDSMREVAAYFGYGPLNRR